MTQQLPDPPYPADTRAKGWRYELDMERVKQSDTWLRARSGAVRGALLLLWSEAWQQTPCGTLPDDDELIALLIDMAPASFAKAKPVLMRGWLPASNGRLYHPVITERVQEMLQRRRKEAERKAAARAGTKPESDGSQTSVPGLSHGTGLGLLPESDTGTGTSTGRQGKTEKPARKRAAPSGAVCPDDVAEEVWRDWCELRKAKRATVTPTVIAEARAESAKAGMTLEAFLRVWCVRGSQGLQAGWLKPNERAVVVPINRQEALEARNQAVADEWLAQQGITP